MHISLDGQWMLSYCPVGTGTLQALEEWLAWPYTVPGDVHTTFIEQGMIPEPLVGMGDEACRWLEEQEFWCVRRFDLAREEMRRQMLLTFEGLDCTADIWLNGTFLGRSNNAFVEAVFDVTACLQAGENTLVVRIDQGLEAVRRQDLRGMERMWNNDQPYRALMRKPQYVYGWDWTLWLPTCGIWRSVSMTGQDRAYLSDLHAWTEEESLQDGHPARIRLAWETVNLDGGSYQVRCRVADAQGNPAAECMTAANGAALVIDRAQLWWCSGLGEPHLYSVNAELLDAQGCCVHALSCRLGLRTVTLRQEALGDGESGFTFVLNGTPVFCKGANVTPADCLAGRVTPGRERELVAMAQQAHMNMLRVWGGGVYASEAFLEACDRAGLMVWHDFMFACGYYPDDDPAFMANVEREATLAIRRLRRHACLIGWAGNNEIQEMYASQSRWKQMERFFGESIYTELLPRLVKALHPGAVYRESSPLGGEDPAGASQGDQHIWHFTHRPNDPLYLDLWRFTDFRAKFLSEFGVIGAMSLESARQAIGEDHLDPDDPVWLHHTNNSQGHGLLNVFVDKYFGGHAGLPVQQYILRSQAIQAEVVRHIYDEFRARKFECSGLLFWTLGDSFGIHNWSLIDYYLRPKPAYYAMKRAMAPVAVCIRGYDVQSDKGTAEYRTHWAKGDTLRIQGMNDTREEKRGILVWRLMTVQGRILASGKAECALLPNASVQLAEVPVQGVDPEQTLLHAAFWQQGACVSESRYFLAPFARMLPAQAKPACRVESAGEGSFRLMLRSDCFVWMLHIESSEGVQLSDNDFDLIPGEERIVYVTTGEADYIPRLHWLGESDHAAAATH